MDNPYFRILGHATGRLILSRDPYPVDMKRILSKMRDHGHLIELNANPYRLDVGSDYCRMAKEMGIKLTISTDAHSIEELNNIHFGIDEARRGWIEASDVLNALPLAASLKRISAR